MATLTRTLQHASRNRFIYAVLLLVLAVLLVVSPAEATLGNVVKIVYAHGAAERIAAYAYVIAGGLGVAQLILRRDGSIRWTQAVAETAIVFWLAQFIISAPAQVLAWGAFDFSEPRVAGALWILVMTVLVYIVARWIDDKNSLGVALGAIANLVIFLIVMRGEINILHPGNAIIASDSLAIKAFYAAIVITMGLLALQFARDRANA